MKRSLRTLLLVALSFALAHAAESDVQDLASLKARIAEQQAQIDELREALVQQGRMLNQIAALKAPGLPKFGEVASTAPVIPSATPLATVAAFAQAAPARPENPQQPDTGARLDAVTKAIEGINANLRGFRFSGDFRYRMDLQMRSGNEFAAPLQNARGRYRLRLNVDKDLAAGLSAHAQLSTGPFVNEITNDQDFASLGVKHPFSLAEAWVRYAQKNFAVRGGRMEEVFADNSRFLWDDDIRLNGFDARYTVGLGRGTSLEFRAGEYILTNPNVTLVPAGSPYLSIGYRVGQKVRDATLFHPGFILRAKTSGWAHQFYGDVSWYRNADQIQLASTAAGFPLLASNGVGLALSGPITGTGNAVTTPGGALLAARHWQIVRGGWRADYADLKLGKSSMPFWADLQSSVNAGTGSDRVAWMATANLGATRKLGDVRFLYQLGYKQANSVISQFTDDDLGTGTGVNIRVNAIRFDLGLTRFLQWQNVLFLQSPLESNRPGFFVNLPRGANTTVRYLGQLAFSF